MPYPPTVSLVGVTTLRWAGAGTYGGTIAVPAGVQPGDVLVVVGMHLPKHFLGAAKFIDGNWFGADHVDDSPILHGWHIVEAGDPESYQVNFAPGGGDETLVYEQDGPAGNCVMLALRGVDYVGRTTTGLYLPHPSEPGYTPPPDPLHAGVIANQHGGTGYDPAAVLNLDVLPPRPPCPVVIVAYALAGSVGFWGQGGVGHYEYIEQTCSWTTPVDESGVLGFTEVVDLNTGLNLAVAYALNVPAVAGPVGNVRSTPSAWEYGSHTDPNGILGVMAWGRLLYAAYPADDTPPPAAAAGWYVGHPWG